MDYTNRSRKRIELTNKPKRRRFKSPVRYILEDIIRCFQVEAQNGGYDGPYSYMGIKRSIYGLWHNGYNERGEYMLRHDVPEAQEFYRGLIKKYKYIPELEMSMKDLDESM